MTDNLARFRQLQKPINYGDVPTDTVSGAINQNYQNIAQKEAQIQAYLESVRKSQEQSQPTEPNMTVEGTTEAPSYDFETPMAGESAQMGNVPRVTQAFGNRSSVEAYSKGVNLGTDFGVKKGTPLALPPGEWEVMTTFSGAKEGNRAANSGSGNLVKVINTKTGEMLAFEHLSGVGVRPGQTINGGTVIGLSGNTGNSTGPHASIPYQDAQGKYHDVLSSPYAQYIFGKGGGDTTGKGGGKLDTIKMKALEYLSKIPGALDSGVKATGNALNSAFVPTTNPLASMVTKGLSNMFIYNQEKQRAFPQGWGSTDLESNPEAKEVMSRQKRFKDASPETQKQITDYAVNSGMAMSMMSPQSTSGNRLMKLDPGSALDQSMDILRSKQSTDEMIDDAYRTINSLGERYGVTGKTPTIIGNKLMKVLKDANPIPPMDTPFQKSITDRLNPMTKQAHEVRGDLDAFKPLSVEPVGGKVGIVEPGNNYAQLKGVDPESTITVYRGVKASQNGKLTGGEWVTQDKELARLYSRNRARASGEDAKIISQKVKAKDLIIDPETSPGVENEFRYTPSPLGGKAVAQGGLSDVIKKQLNKYKK